MNLSLFSAAKKEPQMSLKKLISEAVDVELELGRLNSLDGELSPKAYLEACAAVSGTSAKEAEAIEKQLDGGHEGELLAPSFRRMLKGIRDFKRSGPHLKLSGYTDDTGDAALARIHATRQSLFFAAARAATKQPALFGTATKVGATDSAIKAGIARRLELHARIETEFTAGDVELTENGARFRLAPAVAVAAGCAERLVNAHLAELETAEAA
jgi:hypothetical protein